MTGETEFYGKFSGTARQDFIFRHLFGMLSEGNRMTDNDGICMWLEETTDWDCGFSEEHECLFASLAKAQPDAPFSYGIRRVLYDLEQWCHDVDYDKGTLKLETFHIDNFHFDEDIEEWDYDKDIHSSDVYRICSEGTAPDRRLSGESNEFEKERLSKWLELIETGADNPSDLLALGILYETGLAGVDRNMTAAWDCYLKAAGTGDKDVIEFVKKVFVDDSREDLHELLANKCISRESYPVFFDLAVKEKNTELTAQLLEYKASLE